jgi:hypothetical protein
MMNWKGCGRKRSWPNLRYYTGICLEGLRKTTKTCPSRNFNTGPPECEARVLNTWNTTFGANKKNGEMENMKFTKKKSQYKQCYKISVSEV